MNKTDLQKLQKIEDRIYDIARENGLVFKDIEFDIIPAEKMFEMMAYGIPGQISNWKYGRDYERTRTIYDKVGAGLPYEVVVNTDPARAYLMKDNTFGLQVLIIAHVVGHCAFFEMNESHKSNDNTIASRLGNASVRFEEYEKKYGIDLVEKTIDAGHALMLHSNPWLSEETEEEKIERIFEREKKKAHDKKTTAFGDMFEDTSLADIERERWNYDLYIKLKNMTPVEPTEDLLRYIIDNSRALSSWQKDILEMIRSWGQYCWPSIKTKYMNEGFATYWHEKILRQLFREGYLTPDDHAECNYSNSLVKAKNPFSMNPYLVGYEIWEDIIDRWNKGKHGRKWEEITNYEERKNYDTGAMKGHEKMMRVLRTSTNDWMFMNNFLTTDLVRKLKLYMYVKQENPFYEDLVVTDKKAKEMVDVIVRSFSHSGIPKVFVINGNHNNRGELLLQHQHIGADLDNEYAQKTLEHIQFVWGEKCSLKTKKGKLEELFIAKKHEVVDNSFDISRL